MSFQDCKFNITQSGKILGTATINNKDQSELLDLYIEKEHRRKGAGSHVLKALKIKKLECTSWNETGIAFYTSQGFKVASKDNYLIQFQKE